MRIYILNKSQKRMSKKISKKFKIKMVKNYWVNKQQLRRALEKFTLSNLKYHKTQKD